MTAPIKIGISSCLLGNNVRYDGSHKLDEFIIKTLGTFVEFVPVCPETECGLGIPRDPMRLEGNIDMPGLIVIKSGKDLTTKMKKWSVKRVIELKKEDLCGFIFKSKSPSCGIKQVDIFDKKGEPAHKGTGLFAQQFMIEFPLVPVEGEESLHHTDLREKFIERIFAFGRLREKNR